MFVCEETGDSRQTFSARVMDNGRNKVTTTNNRIVSSPAIECYNCQGPHLAREFPKNKPNPAPISKGGSGFSQYKVMIVGGAGHSASVSGSSPWDHIQIDQPSTLVSADAGKSGIDQVSSASEWESGSEVGNTSASDDITDDEGPMVFDAPTLPCDCSEDAEVVRPQLNCTNIGNLPTGSLAPTQMADSWPLNVFLSRPVSMGRVIREPWYPTALDVVTAYSMPTLSARMTGVQYGTLWSCVPRCI